MKRILRMAALASMLLIGACGGDGGGSIDSTPAIANLRISPASALQLPGGTVTVTGTIDFTDAGGDASMLHLTTSAGANLSIPVSLPGVTSGTIVGDFAVSVDQAGHYTFDVWLVDAAGNSSNHLTGSFDVLINDTASSWREIPLTLSYGPLLDGAWNGSLYVAVGAAGQVVTSSDALTWTEQPAAVNAQLAGIAWSGFNWVAVGADASGHAIIMTSVDGMTWAQAFRSVLCGDPLGTTPSCAVQQALWKPVWDGTQFVAVGTETIYGGAPTALIMTSPDGLSWAPSATGAIPVGTDEGLGMASVAAHGGMLVAVGQAADGTAAIWTSADGSSWQSASVPLSGQRVLRDVAWGPAGFVAVGWGGTPATVVSADGLVWQANQDTQSLPAMNAVAAGPDQYLAVGNTDVETSSTGTTWSVAPSSRSCGNSVLWDGARWVAFGAEVCVSP